MESERRSDAAPSAYLHGTHPGEQTRLSLLNDLLNDGSLREMRLRGGERILDVGSGLGQLTRAMARAAGPGARVIGVERSPEQIAEARRQAVAVGEEKLVEFRQGDALSLPLGDDEWGSFDIAHARFVLEHVPDPLTLVRAMLQSVRPGGRIILEDDDHEIMRLWPEPGEFKALWQAYTRAYEWLGNDPIVGRRLVSLLHEAGAAPVRNTMIFFGSCAGAPPFEACVENLIGVIAGARERVIGAGALDPHRFDQGVAALQGWRHLPDAAIWYAVAWAEGKR